LQIKTGPRGASWLGISTEPSGKVLYLVGGVRWTEPADTGTDVGRKCSQVNRQRQPGTLSLANWATHPGKQWRSNPQAASFRCDSENRGFATVAE